jgi:ribosome-associated protein
MDIRKLQRAIVDGLEDVKAQNIAVFNTEHLSPLFERVIIASGTSNRQTKALASSVREAVKSRGMDVLRTEGEDNGEWIIVDCGAAVAHIMQPAIRDYYHLEEIWGGKGVRMKMGDTKTSLVKASEPEPAKPGKSARRDDAPARKAAPRKTAPGKTPIARKKTAAAAPAGVVKTIVVKPAAARKTVGPRGTAPARKAAGKAAAKPASRATPRKTARKS